MSEFTDDDDDEHLAQIVGRYPRLFRTTTTVPARSNLQRGWVPIVDELLSSIDKLLDDDRAGRFYIFKIGEKFGHLRVDADLFQSKDGCLQILEPLTAADAAIQTEIRRLIEVASQRSAMICEGCGVASSIRNVCGHVSTLCDTCRARRLADLEKVAQSDAIAKLALHHARLFRGRPPIVESWLLPGWTHIVEALFDAIDKRLDDDQAARFEVRQVKEKFGGLRVYVEMKTVANQDDDDDDDQLPPFSPADEAVSEAIFKLIGQAERDAASICGICASETAQRRAPADDQAHISCADRAVCSNVTAGRCCGA
jgi:hypothetical protein